MTTVYKVTQDDGLSIGAIKLAYNINEATVAPEFAGIECPLMAFDTISSARDFVDFMDYYGYGQFKIYRCEAELSETSPRYIRSGIFYSNLDSRAFWADYWNDAIPVNYSVCTAPIGTVFCKIIVPKKEIK